MIDIKDTMNTNKQPPQRVEPRATLDVKTAVEAELDAARRADCRGDAVGAFRHLERAHVLGQLVTREQVRVHWRMFKWGLQHRRAREVAGQMLRIIGAATKTRLGWVPEGNTGGSDVSAFKKMPIPDDLQRQIDGF